MNSAMKQNRAKTMRRIALATALALLVVSQPQAQPKDESIARLRDVHGNVLVSNEAGLSSGDEALRLVAGTRVITTAKSEVIVEYDNGCRVKLEENQRFEVEKGKPCALLIAQPYTILLTPAGAHVEPAAQYSTWMTPQSMRSVDAECQAEITSVYVQDAIGVPHA